MLGPLPRTLVRIFTYFLRIFLEEKASASVTYEIFSGKIPFGCEHPRASRGTSLTLNRFREITGVD